LPACGIASGIVLTFELGLNWVITPGPSARSWDR
jgi:hypothetical protein